MTSYDLQSICMTSYQYVLPNYFRNFFQFEFFIYTKYITIIIYINFHFNNHVSKTIIYSSLSTMNALQTEHFTGNL